MDHGSPRIQSEAVGIEFIGTLRGQNADCGSKLVFSQTGVFTICQSMGCRSPKPMTRLRLDLTATITDTPFTGPFLFELNDAPDEVSAGVARVVVGACHPMSAGLVWYPRFFSR